MAPTGWATAEEREFLLTFLPEYEACQVKRRYKAFWQRLNVDYFARFPTLDKLFPGRTLADLNDDEKEAYAKATLKQQQVSLTSIHPMYVHPYPIQRLKEWFRWQMNPRSRNAGGSISKKDLNLIYNGRTRGKKPYEVFAKLFQKQVEAEKNTRCEAQGIKGRAQLAVWHEVAKDLYGSATEEQLADVKREMNAAYEEKISLEQAAEEAPGSPSAYLRYLKKLPTLLNHTITPAVQKAGVLAIVTVVGPDPSKGGRIVTQTLQFGDKATTPLFSEEWADHDGVFLEEIARFAARHEYPPEVCAGRSLDTKQTKPDLESEDEDQQDNELVSKDSDSPTSGSGLSAPRTAASPEPVERPPSPPRTPVTRPISIPQVPVFNNNDLPSPQISPALEDGSDNSDNEDDFYRFSADNGSTDLTLPDDNGVQFEMNWDFNDAQWAEFDSTLRKMQCGASTQSQDPSIETASPPSPPSARTLSRPPLVTHLGASPGEPIAPAHLPAQTLYMTTPPNVSRLDPPQAMTNPNPFPQQVDSSTSTFSLNDGYQVSTPSSSSPSVTYTCNSVSLANPFTAFLQPPGSPGAYAINTNRSPPSTSLNVNNLVPQSAPLNPAFSSSSFFPPSYTPPMLPPSATLTNRPSQMVPPLPHQAPSKDSTSLPSSSPSSSSASASAHPSVPRANISKPNAPSPLGQPQTPVTQCTSQRTVSRSLPPNLNGVPLHPPTSLHPPTTQALPSTLHGSSTSDHDLPPPAGTSAITSPKSGEPVSEIQSNAQSLELVMDSTCRRSARAPMPSKRNEQLQLIGTNARAVTETAEKSKEPEDTAWFESATKSLRQIGLGQGFSEMLDKWEKLEVMLGCGNISRGSLPNAKGRPNDWARWASKNWQGMRFYDKHPDIDDPAELGLEITKWWSSFQPAFRASAGAYPLSVYSDPTCRDQDVWTHIRKSGHNGFVSMVMLLAWWGRAAHTSTSEWQEDSRAAWKYVVTDVSRVLDEMTRTYAPRSTSDTAKKRKANNANKENAAPPKKRSKKRA
ncbi:hypothetical protein NMY22_g16618 [Coprinellus aureogranulatus]|nr:hypothetical protein NMY22_g16618 [Coprinellus aureogranulatus]